MAVTIPLLLLTIFHTGISCWSPAEHQLQPLSYQGTLNLRKKGTKMKLLKQHQLLIPTQSLSKHFQHTSQGHRGGKSPEPEGRTSTTWIRNKSTQLHWMVQLRLDLEASGKAIGTQAGQHRIHLSPAGGEALCGTRGAFNNATAALKNFCS